MNFRAVSRVPMSEYKKVLKLSNEGNSISSISRLLSISNLLNGVKFDGVVNNILVDAKSAGYANFVKNGSFQSWFTGSKELVNQANRQLQAAGGTKIQWYFQDKSAMQATQKLFNDEGIKGIELIYKAMP